MRKTKSGLPRVLSLGLTALLLTSCVANPPAETNAQPEPVATTTAPEGVYANAAGYIKPSEVESVAALAWSAVHGFTMLADGQDPMRPTASPKAIDDLIERTWQGIVGGK